MDKSSMRILIIVMAIFIVPLVFVILYYSYDEIFLSHGCLSLEREKSEAVNGIVMDKFIDKENHMEPAILLKQNGRTVVYQFGDTEERELWNALIKGDSLIKNIGHNEFKVIRQGKALIYPIKYNCEDKR